MAPRRLSDPSDPGPGPGDLYDASRLARRLGVTPATLRQHRAAGASWLVAPAGVLNGGAVWEAKAIHDIEARRAATLHPGRKTADDGAPSLAPTVPVSATEADASPPNPAPAQDNDHATPAPDGDATSGDGWWDDDSTAPGV